MENKISLYAGAILVVWLTLICVQYIKRKIEGSSYKTVNIPYSPTKFVKPPPVTPPENYKANIMSSLAGIRPEGLANHLANDVLSSVIPSELADEIFAEAFPDLSTPEHQAYMSKAFIANR